MYVCTYMFMYTYRIVHTSAPSAEARKAVHCNTRQHTAPQCNTLQHATHTSLCVPQPPLLKLERGAMIHFGVPSYGIHVNGYVANPTTHRLTFCAVVSWSVLHCVCLVLHHTDSIKMATLRTLLPTGRQLYVAIYCSMLRVCCRVLQDVAVCHFTVPSHTEFV